MLDLRVGVHAHHIHVASQLLGLRARNVTRLVHVLDHTQLDTVTFALHLFRLRLRLRARAHIRARPQRSLASSVIQQQCRAMFRIVRVAAHLLIQAVDHMFDGIHLHRAGVREQLVVAEQRGSAANAAVHTLHHRAQTPLQRPEAAL